MKFTRRVVYTLLFAAVSGLGACDRTDRYGELTGPAAQQDLIESVDATIDGGTLDGGATLDGASLTGTKKVEPIKRRYPLSTDMTWTTQSPIGPLGGTLTFGTANHKLVIPPGAVLYNTHFSATMRAGEEIRVDLRAWNGTQGNVTQFLVPVRLTFNLADAATDMSTVAVFYLNPNGQMEQQPTTVDVLNRTVTGYLNHFSDYIPGTLRSDTTTQAISTSTATVY
jgi:hypothetical protein